MSARKPTLSQSVLLNTTTRCFPAKYTAKDMYVRLREVRRASTRFWILKELVRLPIINLVIGVLLAAQQSRLVVITKEYTCM